MTRTYEAFEEDGAVFVEQPDGEPAEIATVEELAEGLNETEADIRKAVEMYEANPAEAEAVTEQGFYFFGGMLTYELDELRPELPTGLLNLRLFQIDEPENAKQGAITFKKNGEWEINSGWTGPGKHPEAVEAYRTALIERGITDQGPPAQLVHENTVVVAEKFNVTIPEDELEVVFHIDPVDCTTLPSGCYDIETGLTAEREFDDTRIAKARQRACEIVDYDFDWVGVISDDVFGGVADAADDLI